MKRPSLVGIAVFVAVGITHYAYDPLSLLFDKQAYAARNIFYAMRGIEGVVLLAIIGMLAKSLTASVACLWGITEEGLTAACRIIKGIGEPNPSNHVQFAGLCGPEAYWIGAVFAALMGLAIVYELGRLGNGTKGT